MIRSVWPASSIFRPGDEGLSAEERSKIQVHRLLSLLGAALVPSVGALFAVTTPQATDPAWARLGVASLFALLLGASYGSSAVRQHYPAWMRGVLYVLLGWFATIAALNGLAGHYDMGLLLLCGMLPVVVALGAESMGPVWRFLGFGVLAGTAGAVLGPALTAETLVLTGSLATIALVEGIALRGQFAARGRLGRQNDLFARAQSLANIGAWEYEVASGKLFWTEQVYDIHGLPSSFEPTVEKGIEFYHADDRPIIRNALDRAVEEGEPYDEELRLTRADGEQRWVQTRGTPQIEDGEVVRVRGAFQDITERKTRQQRLETLRERLALAVDGAGLGTWDWDLGTDEVVFNHQWAEMLGYSREELDFDFDIWEELVHPDDLPKATAALEAHFAGETDIYEQELRMQTESGDWKWIQTIGQVAERDEDGTPIRAAGIHLDIDDRKRDKQELRARGLAMETSIDGMAILGPNDEYQFVNQAHADIYGYDDPEAFLGETWQMCYGKGERARFREKIFPVLRENGSWRGEALGQRRDGTTFPQEVSLTLTEKGRIVGVVRDITERKVQERRLRELAGEYETTLDNVTDAIFLMDVVGTGPGAEFRFERLSASYEAKTGLTTDEVQGKTPREVFGEDPGEELKATFHRCVETEKPVTYEEEVVVDGETRIWQTSLAPVHVGGATERIVGIGRDITERVERERELERKNARLDSFAGLVSHDLRNPLNVATGRLRLAREEDDPSHLAAIGRALERMDAIIEDVLTLTWSGRDIGSEELATQDLTPLAEASWDQVDTADATLRLDDPPRLRCDEDRLRRLLENLFRNAVEHGGKAVSVRVGRLDDGFYVEDDGSGFPEGSHESVFEAGYSSNEEGTGLGLAIVKSIAETHGWSLTATESPAGGARFEVTGVNVEVLDEAIP